MNEREQTRQRLRAVVPTPILFIISLTVVLIWLAKTLLVGGLIGGGMVVFVNLVPGINFNIWIGIAAGAIGEMVKEMKVNPERSES
jgi:hypothetical protein